MSVVQVKERPILFNGEMVRAILDGCKTVTRRPVKGIALEWLRPNGFTPEFTASQQNGLCPYGHPGERIWVRETWAADAQLDSIAPRDLSPGEPIRYHADGQVRQQGCAMISVGKSRPNIFMPRWACRILLEVTEVRVERLQDISDDQIIAEGIDLDALAESQDRYDMVLAGSGADGRATLRTAYRDLWSSTGGDWSANPWVWVIEFKQIDAHQLPANG